MHNSILSGHLGEKKKREKVLNAFHVDDRGPLTFKALTTAHDINHRYHAFVKFDISVLNMAIIFEADDVLEHILSTDIQHSPDYPHYFVKQGALKVLKDTNQRLFFSELETNAYKRMRNPEVFGYVKEYAQTHKPDNLSDTTILAQDLWLDRYRAMSKPVRRLAKRKLNGAIVEDMDEIKFGSLSPLMLAVAQGNVFAVQRLLEKGADIFEVRSYKKRETMNDEEVPYPRKPAGPGEDVSAILERVKAIHSNAATRDNLVPAIYPAVDPLVNGGDRDLNPAYDSDGEEPHNSKQPHSFSHLRKNYKTIEKLLEAKRRETSLFDRLFRTPRTIDA